MSDREILECAAKAVGLEVRPLDRGPMSPSMQRKVDPWPGEPFSKWVEWNPIKNGGDTFNLMHACELEIRRDENDYGEPIVVAVNHSDVFEDAPSCDAWDIEGLRRIITISVARIGGYEG